MLHIGLMGVVRIHLIPLKFSAPTLSRSQAGQTTTGAPPSLLKSLVRQTPFFFFFLNQWSSGWQCKPPLITDMINSFIMLDWFNYLLCRFVYLICISMARVQHSLTSCRSILRKVSRPMQVPGAKEKGKQKQNQKQNQNAYNPPPHTHTQKLLCIWMNT